MSPLRLFRKSETGHVQNDRPFTCFAPTGERVCNSVNLVLIISYTREAERVCFDRFGTFPFRLVLGMPA